MHACCWSKEYAPPITWTCNQILIIFHLRPMRRLIGLAKPNVNSNAHRYTAPHKHTSRHVCLRPMTNVAAYTTSPHHSSRLVENISNVFSRPAWEKVDYPINAIIIAKKFNNYFFRINQSCKLSKVIGGGKGGVVCNGRFLHAYGCVNFYAHKKKKWWWSLLERLHQQCLVLLERAWVWLSMHKSATA